MDLDARRAAQEADAAAAAQHAGGAPPPAGGPPTAGTGEAPSDDAEGTGGAVPGQDDTAAEG